MPFADGHDKYQDIAMDFKRKLEKRGHTVWIDVERLSAGIDWESGISDALTWVKESHENGRVILMMTPHALRRPDGYCLNEIARAVEFRLNIFPVLICESDIPESISILPYFDMQDCVPIVPGNIIDDANAESQIEHEIKELTSDEWKVAFETALNGPIYQEKSQRFFNMLELCENMLDNGIVSLGGIKNLFFSNVSHCSTPHSNTINMSGGAIGKKLVKSSSRKFLFTRMKTGGSSTGSLLATTPRFLNSRQSSVSSNFSDYNIEEEKNFMLNQPPAPAFPSNCLKESNESNFEAGESTTAPNTRLLFSFEPSCIVLAQLLYDDLTALGYEIFPIDGFITNEKPHEDAFQEGIEWAIQKPDTSSKMILFLTPNSVGRGYGLCLNDVTRAMEAGLGFVPLLVRRCDIPLSICRIQWLDLSDCLLYSNPGSTTKKRNSWVINKIRYESRKQQLVAALVNGLDHEGNQARITSSLPSISFQSQIASHTEYFTGREWVVKKIRIWLASKSRLFVISGQIGCGKSAIASHLIRSCGEILAYHFASQDDETTHSTRRAILSIAYQISTQLKDFAHALLQGEPLEEIVPVSNVATLLETVLLRPLNSLSPPPQPNVILIDGLEHFCQDNNNNEDLFTLLPDLLNRSPPWLRVIVLCREETKVTSHHQLKAQYFTSTDNIISLDFVQDQTHSDITEYLRGRLQPYYQEKKKSDIPDELVQFIAKRAEGLFLYACHIVNAVVEGRLDFDNLETFPMGMADSLHHFFQNQFILDEYKKEIRPVLEVLCAAIEPLSLPLLNAIMNWQIYDQNEVISKLGSMFYISQENILKPFHSSLFNWVQDPHAAGLFYAEASEGHKRIGMWAINEYETTIRPNTDLTDLTTELENAKNGINLSQTRIYIIRHAHTHLIKASGEECIKLQGRLARDQKFQLAQSLLKLRDDGLESFFHGDITRELSQHLLKSKPMAGSFLIRYSERRNSYCASFIHRVDESGVHFRHNLIHHLDSGAYSVVRPRDVTASTVLYPDLTSFVEAYQKLGILKYSIPRRGGLNRSISLKGS